MREFIKRLKEPGTVVFTVRNDMTKLNNVEYGGIVLYRSIEV